MTNNDIKVTIVTPSYNQGQFIERTIQSVLNQTYTNIEYIVVDGGSTDETMEIVNKYSDRIDIIIHEKDTGQGNAINKGFKLATGELAGWINSDDMLYPTCVEEIVKLYASNKDGCVFYSSLINIVDLNDKITSNYTVNIPNRDYLLKSDYDVCQPGSFYPSNMLKKINYLDEDLHYCMDLDLWLRLLNLGKIYSHKKNALAAFRYGDYTKTYNGRRKFAKEIRETLLKNGAHLYNFSIIHTFWVEFKDRIKKIIRKDC
ncbi:glycosyltransferase family 2 protein [Viscerimonas tarda]